MSINDQIQVLTPNTGSIALLRWLNQEKQFLGCQKPVASLHHAVEDGILETLFEKISSELFGGICIEQFASPTQLAEFVALIEKYLEKQLGKRIKWGYKQQMMGYQKQEGQQSSGKELTKICCYCCLQCPQKHGFINRILQLPQPTQQKLMQQMQDLERSKLQNILQIKQILHKIDELEEQSETLKSQLEQWHDKYSKALMINEQTNRYNKQLNQQLSELRKEKIEAFNYIKISFTREYLEVYVKLQEENKELYDMLAKTEECKEELQKCNIELKEKVKNDCVLISELAEEAQRYKELYLNAKEEAVFANFNNTIGSTSTITSLRGRMLSSTKSDKENRILDSLSNMDKIGLREIKSNNISQEQADFDADKVRQYNRELMHRIEDVYVHLNSLNQEASTLREQNQYLLAKMANKKNVLSSIRKWEDNFMQGYSKLSDGQIRNKSRSLRQRDNQPRVKTQIVS